MEDILASIRRILSEEDAPGAPTVAKAPESPAQATEPDVLILDRSMLVADGPSQPVARTAPPPPPPVIGRETPPPPPDVLIAPVIVEPEPMPETIIPVSVETSPVAEPEQPVAEDPIAETEPEPDTAEPAEMAKSPDQDLPLAVRTEPPMQSDAIPALTSEPSPMGGSTEGFPGSAPTRPGTMRPLGSPVLIPVPLSGQSPVPPLIRRPAFALGEPIATVAPSPTQADPQTDSGQPVPLATSSQSESPPMSASMSSSAAGGIASPETATAAAGSVTNLVRALTSDRGAQVHSGGPTIADLVREELRPMLKAWLDSNLPPLVERLVRAEIERVISRASV